MVVGMSILDLVLANITPRAGNFLGTGTICNNAASGFAAHLFTTNIHSRYLIYKGRLHSLGGSTTGTIDATARRLSSIFIPHHLCSLALLLGSESLHINIACEACNDKSRRSQHFYGVQGVLKPRLLAGLLIKTKWVLLGFWSLDTRFD